MSRVLLPVIGLARPLVEGTECARCCTYVGVGIDPPTSARHATDVLWYLYHEGEPAEFLEWPRASWPRIYAKIGKAFVPRALRPLPPATARTARAARRGAVARKARI